MSVLALMAAVALTCSGRETSEDDSLLVASKQPTGKEWIDNVNSKTKTKPVTLQLTIDKVATVTSKDSWNFKNVTYSITGDNGADIAGRTKTSVLEYNKFTGFLLVKKQNSRWIGKCQGS